MLRCLLIVILLTSQTFACLWDRDTLAEEAKGRPDLVKIIVGWFDRYPPEYYQIRLGRVTRDLQSTPNDLALYDDAAVACDRLGRSDDAIGWMAKKKVVLDKLPGGEAKDHRYRYLSNLGTFYLHRWISLPREKREADLADLRESEKQVARAIGENPNAHFGREVYQLAAIRWLLWDGVSPIPASGDLPFDFDQTHWVHTQMLEPAKEHIDGVSGLIQLGIAWESPDAFRSLAAVLDSGQLSSLAELAYLRESELLAAGKNTLHPAASIREQVYPDHSNFLENRKPSRDYFSIARAAADRRNTEWIVYQKMRFSKGMHPDTHLDFWKDWSEPAFVEPPGPTLMERLKSHTSMRFNLGNVSVLAVVVLIGFFASFFLIRWVRSLTRSNP